MIKTRIVGTCMKLIMAIKNLISKLFYEDKSAHLPANFWKSMLVVILIG